MVIADFSGNYLNAENAKEGDIGTIVSEGEMKDKESQAGKKYTQLDIDVEVNGKKLIHSPSFAEGKKLVKAWGKETKEWIGKTFNVHIIRLQGDKLKAEIDPIVEQKV